MVGASSTERAARTLKAIKDEEWRTLYALEKASLGQGAADAGKISRLARIPLDRVTFALDALNAKGLIARRGASHALTMGALEVMALREYVRRDVLAALGPVIAKGKESDVYEAFDDDGRLFALKFFKLGRTSFTRVRKKRFVDRTEVKNWMTVNYEAAKREYSALRRLRGLSPAFPVAVSWNRSTVLLEELSGVRLAKRPELVDPAGSRRAVLRAERTAYLQAGLVNGDLSEYNILTDGESVWLIDWPQAVGRSHPNAPDLLRHDVLAVVRFFERAYGLPRQDSAALAYVEGRRESLE